MKSLKILFAQAMAVFLIVSSIFCLWILPILNISTFSKFILLFAYALLSYTYWQVLHEAIHNHLFKLKIINTIFGRLLAVLFGTPYHVLQVGHLTHHAMNREKGDRTEIIERSDSWLMNAWSTLKFYCWILGGLYVTEVIGILAGFLPKAFLLKLSKDSKATNPVKARVLAKLTQYQKFIQIDGLMIMLFYGISIYLYSESIGLLLMIIAMRALFVSLLDNIYHHGTPLDQKRFAFNLKLPAWLSVMFLHANYHGLHHAHPKLHWSDLPKQMQTDRVPFHHKFFAHLWLELKGPSFR